MEWKIAVLVLSLAGIIQNNPLKQNNKVSIDKSQYGEDFFIRHGLIQPPPPSMYNTKNDFVPINPLNDEETATYRLPNNSVPLQYEIFLKTDVDKANFDFTGRVKIHIKIIEPSTTITLHYRKTQIDKVDLLDVNGVLEEANLILNYDMQREFLIVNLSDEKSPNEEILLDIQYHGVIRDDSSGFYRAKYYRDGNKDDIVWFATTQFEQTDARHAFPCFDEPGIRAVYSVEIQHDASYDAVSNMPLLSRNKVPESNYVISKFEKTPPMQTYLLAFIISDYDYVSNNEVDVPQRVFATPQLIKKHSADYAAEIVGPVLRKLEEHLKVDFPLPKMDHAAIRDYIWGAMENFGLITYAEDGLLYERGVDPVYMEKNILELVAHEYVHQWFGNIVNPQWWSYTWLNEGFASFFQYYIPSLMFPEEDYMHRMMLYSTASAFNSDQLSRNPVPMNHYVETPADINRKFNVISYAKSGNVLRMFQEALGTATFTKGLNYYLEEMYYKAVEPADLHRALQKAYDESNPGNNLNIDEVMSTWESQSGYPLVTVTRAGNFYTLTQERFGGGNEIYTIPISYATKANPNFEKTTAEFFMASKTGQIPAPSDGGWILLNIQQTGYYKVSYEKSNWLALIKALNKNHETIPKIHRAQIFKDYPALYKDYLSILELMSYLENENEKLVWEEFMTPASFIGSHLFASSVHDRYNEFVSSLLRPHLNRLGFDQRSGESKADAELRPLLVAYACEYLDLNCLNYQLKKLETAIKTGQGSYDLCFGIKLASEEMFDRFIKVILEEQQQEQRYPTIDALSCSLNRNNLNKLLGLILDTGNDLSTGERFEIIISSILSSPVAFESSLEFIEKNSIKLHEM